MTYLSNDDYTAYFSSSSEELVLLIAGMTSLIIHKQGVIQSIKEYPWFHRLSKSVFGKHDITTEELSEQMDQTIGYCLETIASPDWRGLTASSIRKRRSCSWRNCPASPPACLSSNSSTRGQWRSA